MSQLGATNKKAFPRTNVATLRPGRFEIMTGTEGDANAVNNNAMTSAQLDRQMEIRAPSAQYNIPPTVTPNSSTVRGTTRDNPGVFRSFGGRYLRNNPLPSLEGAVAEGPPLYRDYKTVKNEDGSFTITELTDFWTPLLDEMRYCKHIYAMKFAEKVFHQNLQIFLSPWEVLLNGNVILLKKQPREPNGCVRIVSSRFIQNGCTSI